MSGTTCWPTASSAGACGEATGSVPGRPVSFFTLCRRFTVLRNHPDHAWLRALPAAEVRYALKYLADAYARYFAAD